MSSLLRLKVLRENQCTVLCCTPTYALHLAEVAASEGIDLSSTSIRTIVVAGEPGGSQPAIRQRLSKAWAGARIFDHHGMTETGPVTYEHPEEPGTLVILSDSFQPEVVDVATGKPLPEGFQGELVLTTLRRLGSPLIRYRTGDLVRLERRNHLWVLPGGILGRVDDMVIIRGVNVYPSALDELVRSVPGTGEFRVIHDQREPLSELSLEVEGDAIIAQTLAHRIQESLALRIPVKPVPAGSLPRFEHKARRWQRLT